jgi:hypothetical protein
MATGGFVTSEKLKKINPSYLEDLLKAASKETPYD